MSVCAHLLFAWEGMVVTWHIGHDGLFIGTQRTNDICPGKEGAGTEREKEVERKGENKKHRVKDCIDTKANRAQFYRNDTRYEEVSRKSHWLIFRRLEWRHTHAFIIRLHFLHATGGKTHATVGGAWAPRGGAYHCKESERQTVRRVGNHDSQ